jgi:hypothetical protein
LETLEAAGNGFNVGFNYSHLEKQDNESLTERLEIINQKIIVAAGQLGFTGGAQPIFVFFPNPRKTSIQLLLEAQQHKKYAQTTPLDDGVSSLFHLISALV